MQMSQKKQKPANKLKNHRRCISCRQVKEKSSFIKIVRNFSDGEILIDQGMGRSAYICPQAECITIAQKQKKISRSLRRNINPEVYELLWQLIKTNQ